MKKQRLIFLLLLALACILSCQEDTGGGVEPTWTVLEEDKTPVVVEEEYDILSDSTIWTLVEAGKDSGIEVPLDDFERFVSEISSDELQTKTMYYQSQTDSLFFTDLALEVIDKNVTAVRSKRSQSELAEEVIANAENINIFADEYEIEQVIWNCGTWGASNWGNFQCFFNTVERYDGKYVVVVLYKEGGFSRDGYAYLKLGTVNSGKVLTKRLVVAGRKYVVLPYKIDFETAGCVNIFPLVISNNKYRSYLNPIMIKTKPIIAKGWTDMEYGDVFGTIDGVNVYCNSSKDRFNIGGSEYQCVELCKRYLSVMHPEIKRKQKDIWGHANQWPYNRANDDIDVGKYIVLKNDGTNAVREGDIIVFQHSKFGHVAVVIKNAPDYISIAHQNAASGEYDIPIGTKLAKKGNYVTNYHPTTGKSPIFSGYNYVSHFIRFNNDLEHYQEVIPDPEPIIPEPEPVIPEPEPVIPEPEPIIPEPEPIDDKSDLYVDFGLPSGTKWAKCNVGANNPWEYGYLLAWGETSVKSIYGWSTYKHSDGEYILKYYSYNGESDGRYTLESSDDAATVIMGGDWRMPTKDELKELYDYCTWTWTANYSRKGVAGYVVSRNGVEIFLPAAGFAKENEGISRRGERGYYLSSSLNADNPLSAWSIYYDQDYQKSFRKGGTRCYGQSVRAVWNR
ncbi:MAG: CHAP domain-containing protein [Bacteroidales bacterium]|nr:CHAP domain-containing protein [Bacteroidales bacterium]